MYAIYTYNTSATLANIHDDIFEIFCGETTPSNLSAGCDTANTSILTTYSTSPWVDFDDVSATERIMRLESSDDSGVYKYVGWHSGGSNELAFALMESWDAGTDTPTNEVVAEFSYQTMGVFIGTGGVVHIYSSTFCTIIMHENTAGLFGNHTTSSNYGSLGIFEVDRSHPSHALGDMPNWCLANTAMVWGDGDASMDCTFWKGRDHTDTVQTPFTATLAWPGRDLDYDTNNSYAITGALGSATALPSIGADTQYGLEPIMVGGSFADTSYLCEQYYGNISARCDIWFMPVGSEGVGNLVQINSLPYVVFKLGYTASTTGNQYGGKFIVPYG